MWPILENVPCALEKKVYIYIGWNVLKISMRSISSNVSFKTCFPINFLFWLSVHRCKRGVKFTTVIAHCQFLLLCLLVFILCIEVLLWWVHRYLQCYVFLLDWSLDDHVVSSLISCNPLYFKVYFVWYEDCYSAFFCFPFAWNIFFHPITFSLYVSWSQKQVSCRQHMYGSCFSIHSASLCLLVGAFNPFTFKVIIDMYVPIAIFLIVWGCFCRSFFFSCISWLYKSL